MSEAIIFNEWCEALSFDENVWLTKGSIRGGCRAKVIFWHSIENLEYQMLISENGAGCAVRRINELQFGATIDPFHIHLILIYLHFVVFVELQF